MMTTRPRQRRGTLAHDRVELARLAALVTEMDALGFAVRLEIHLAGVAPLGEGSEQRGVVGLAQGGGSGHAHQSGGG